MASSYTPNRRGFLQKVAAAFALVNGDNNTRVEPWSNELTEDGGSKATILSDTQTKLSLQAAQEEVLETKKGELGGSWTDGMKFEKYDPAKDTGDVVINAQWQAEAQGPPLRIPCSLMLPGDQIHPVHAILDTGRSQTVMTRKKAREIGLISKAKTTEIDSKSITLRMGGAKATVPAPSISIVESLPNGQVDLVLGLDFLRAHRAVIDIRDEEMRMINADGVEVFVPFLRLRGGGIDFCENE